MRIQVKQNEIIDALKQYVNLQGIPLENKTVTVSFLAGRKGKGLSAEIVVDEAEAVSAPAPVEAAEEESEEAPAAPAATPSKSLFG